MSERGWAKRLFAARTAPDPIQEPVEPISARGPWGLVWLRLRHNRIAFASGIVFLTIAVFCFVGAPVLAALLGHGPNDQFPYAVSQTLKPVGFWTHVPDVTAFVDIDEETPRTLFVLGADGTLGRDLLLRVLYGGQVSLTIGIGGALLALLLGVPLGMLAGYVGGWLDWTISRWTELFMGFPLLLFLVAIGYTIGFRLSDVTLGGVFPPGVLVLVFLIGAFSWFLPARVIRAQVLVLREEEFVEAARMVGARDGWILRRHVLPHLVGPIAVWGTFITASFVIFEAAISILNLGVKLPTASWGNLIATNWGTLLVYDPNRPQVRTGYFVEESNWIAFWPSAALFVSVGALALFAEGLRRAIDPRGKE